MQKKIAAVVLAAGKSERMNFPKCLLPFTGNISFAEKIANEFSAFGISELIFVLNPNIAKDFYSIIKPTSFIRAVINNNYEAGRFSSFLCGIKATAGRNDFCFLHSVDTPEPGQAVFRSLSDGIKDADYAVPQYKGKGGHPILLGKNLIETARVENNFNLHLRDFLSSFQKIYVPVNCPGILKNINNPEQYADFIKEKNKRQ